MTTTFFLAGMVNSSPADTIRVDRSRYHAIDWEEFKINLEKRGIPEITSAYLHSLPLHYGSFYDGFVDLVHEIVVTNDHEDSLFILDFVYAERFEALSSSGRVYRSGMDISRQEHTNKDVFVRSNWVELSIPPGTTDHFFIRVNRYPNPYYKMDRLTIAPAGFVRLNLFGSNEGIGKLLIGIILGALAILFVFNLLQYYQLNDSTYLLYSAYILVSTVINASEANLYPLIFEYRNSYFITIAVSTPLSMILLALFIRKFTNTKELIYRWDRVLKGMIWFNASGIGITLMLVITHQYYWYFQVNNFYGVTFAAFLVVFLIRLLMTGDILARYAVSGAFILFTVILVYFVIISFSQMFNDLDLLIYLQLGLLGELTLFSLGLGYRHRRNQKDKVMAQEQLIIQMEENKALQTQVTRELEQKVEERTAMIDEQKKQLIAANKTKDRLFSIISHDLRGPLASFESIASLIRNYSSKKQPEKVDELVDHVNKSAHNVNQLLDNLLSWSLSQQGEIKIDIEKLRLKDMVNEAFEVYRDAAEAKGITLRSEVNDEMILADRYTFATIIRNLLSNAIKFSPEGGKILIRPRKADNFLELAVQDQGVGMDEDQLQNLFLIDKRKVKKGTANEKGTGLGLVLVKEFVELNNGELRFESAKGKGTSFYIRLPLAS